MNFDIKFRRESCVERKRQNSIQCDTDAVPYLQVSDGQWFNFLFLPFSIPPMHHLLITSIDPFVDYFICVLFYSLHLLLLHVSDGKEKSISLALALSFILFFFLSLFSILLSSISLNH